MGKKRQVPWDALVLQSGRKAPWRFRSLPYRLFSAEILGYFLLRWRRHCCTLYICSQEKKGTVLSGSLSFGGKYYDTKHCFDPFIGWLGRLPFFFLRYCNFISSSSHMNSQNLEFHWWISAATVVLRTTTWHSKYSSLQFVPHLFLGPTKPFLVIWRWHNTTIQYGSY